MTSIHTKASTIEDLGGSISDLILFAQENLSDEAPLDYVISEYETYILKCYREAMLQEEEDRRNEIEAIGIVGVY